MEIGPVVLEGTHVRLESLREAHADGLVAAGVGRGLFRLFPNSRETEMESSEAAACREARASRAAGRETNSARAALPAFIQLNS